MKKIFLVLSMLSYCSLIYANSLDSVFLRGFYIVSYNKSEINFLEKTVKNGIINYNLLIDQEYKEYFWEIDTANASKKTFNLSESHSIIVRRKTLHLDALRDWCKQSLSDTDSSKTIFISTTYYKLNKNKKLKNKYFQVFYIEGWFHNLLNNKCTIDIFAKNLNGIKTSVLIPIRFSKIDMQPKIPIVFKLVRN